MRLAVYVLVVLICVSDRTTCSDSKLNSKLHELRRRVLCTNGIAGAILDLANKFLVQL